MRFYMRDMSERGDSKELSLTVTNRLRHNIQLRPVRDPHQNSMF